MSLAIQIISPHLDDAALSCADHIRAWQRSGHRVAVTTLFTDFGTGAPPAIMLRFIVEQGFDNVPDYGEARRAEDLRAMTAMNVTGRHAGLRDAGFRNRAANVPGGNFKPLTASKIGISEAPIVEQAKLEMNRLEAPDLAVLPLGLGQHVDHLIAREAGRAVWGGRCAVSYYCDIPYVRNPLRYPPAAFRLALGLLPSIIRITNWKCNLLDNYRTQMPYLFRGRPRFPEILLLPRGIRKRLAAA